MSTEEDGEFEFRRAAATYGLVAALVVCNLLAYFAWDSGWNQAIAAQITAMSTGKVGWLLTRLFGKYIP